MSDLLRLGYEEELADAALILDAFQKAKLFQGKRQFSALMRLANKSLVTFWETPRLPSPKYTHNKPHGILWSKSARDLYFSEEEIGARLIQEHIYPTDLKAKKLLKLIGVSVSTAEELLAWLEESYSGISLTIITKEEDRLLEGEYRAAVTEDGDIWGRYRAAGLAVESFLPLSEDPRYATQASNRHVTRGRKLTKV